MGTYCTRSDLESRIPADVLLSWSDLDRDGVEDAGVVDLALQAATDLCDSYLSVRFPVPVAEPAGALRNAALAITVWRLASGSGFDVASADKVIKLEYDDAVRWLRDVGAGKAGLPSSAATAETPSAPDVPVVVYAPKAVFVGKLDRYG